MDIWDQDISGGPSEVRAREEKRAKRGNVGNLRSRELKFSLPYFVLESIVRNTKLGKSHAAFEGKIWQPKF